MQWPSGPVNVCRCMRFLLYLCFQYFCIDVVCICVICTVLCSGQCLVQLMFAAACGRRPKLTSHFIVCSEQEEEEDGDGGGDGDGNRDECRGQDRCRG